MKLIILIILFYSAQLRAIISFEDATSPELITSARALAMGNAYMNKVDDGWAAFYNPAGLGTVRGLRFHFINVHLETNNGFLDITGSGSFAESISKFTSAFNPVGLRALHTAEPGNLSHGRFQFFPNMTYKGLTLGYMYAQQNLARQKSLTDNFEISERVDSGPVISLSMSLFGGVVKFGATAIFLTRKELQKDFLPSDTATTIDGADYKKGSMTHITLGTRITLPTRGLPTFSAVLRNSSMSDFYSPEFGGTPSSIPQTVDYSISITPKLSRTFRLHWEVAYKDSGNRYETIPGQRKLMTGFEFDYKRKMFVRFGYGDGWGSGGLGVRKSSFSFDLTTYAVEASEDGIRKEEDRRSVLSVSGGF